MQFHILKTKLRKSAPTAFVVIRLFFLCQALIYADESKKEIVLSTSLSKILNLCPVIQRAIGCTNYRYVDHTMVSLYICQFFSQQPSTCISPYHNSLSKDSIVNLLISQPLLQSLTGLLKTMQEPLKQMQIRSPSQAPQHTHHKLSRVN